MGYGLTSPTRCVNGKAGWYNPANGLSEVVTVLDRGPYVAGRQIDLSRGVAQRIGLERPGVGPVLVEVLR